MKVSIGRNREEVLLTFFEACLLFVMLGGMTPSEVWSAPVISAVSGTVSNGESLTISGTGFGSTGPVIEIFDDFEKGTSGNKISSSAGSAQVNQWDYVQGASTDIVYSKDYALGGTKSCKINAYYSSSMPCLESQINVGPGNGVFFSWWQFMPTNTSVPGTNGPEEGGPNWKLFWLYGWDGYFRSDYVIVVLTNSLPTAYTQLCVADDPNSGNLWRGIGEYSDIFRKGTWTRYWMYWKGGTSKNGSCRAWQANSVSGFKTITNVSTITNQTAGYPWTKLHFPGFLRRDSSSVFYLDDIYVATGANAMARVEIGNQPTYTTCSKLAITTPTQWGESRIVTTLRQGSFSEGQAAYLYVIDSSGNINSSGYPITIGATGGNAPAAPSGLKVAK